MKNEEKRYFEELFYKLEESWDLRKEVSAFGNFYQDPLWIMLPFLKNHKSGLTKADVFRCIKTEANGRTITAKDMDRIYAAVLKARREKELEIFEYGKGLHGFSYPLKANNQVFGSILMCGDKKNITKKMGGLFQSFTDTIVSETQKESELEKLNETIRPRAIALSTVHTVHRLMSSTLNLNELLPRIARLSLQVLRANRCSIKLVDKKKKELIPKTTIDLRKENTKLKKVQIGKYAPGRAVKFGRVVRGKNYLAYPLVEEEVIGVITLYDKLDGSEFTAHDEEIMKTLTEQAVIAIRNAQVYEEQEALTMGSIKCIAMLLETRPHGFHRPEKSFMKLINTIGRKFQMNETEIKMMQYAALLHDTGQIGVPEKVLMKKGGLTGKEFNIVKEHATKGATILSKIKPLRPIVPIILYHHENFDGTGYPKGLKGDEIPLSARILAVVSAFEAMITKKPYRRQLSIDSALKEVSKNTGTQFDPEVVRVFSEAVVRKNVIKMLRRELRKSHEA